MGKWEVTAVLSMGKVRGLQQISSPEGVFVICAMDHRESLKSMIAQGHPGEVSYQEMVDHKRELCESLAPHATAVLLDPDYGVAQCIAAGILPGRTRPLRRLGGPGFL